MTRILSLAVDPATLEERLLRARIDQLRAELARTASAIEELRTTLGIFEARYDARIGVLMVELDRTELEVAMLRRRVMALESSIAEWQRVEATIEETFSAERERIALEAQDASGARRRVADLPPEPEPEVAAAIRTQYRKLARRFHPDVAADHEQREQHERLMRRINVAMEMNDLGTLIDLERELPDIERDPPGPTRGARIAWATAEIARLEATLATRVAELAALQASSLYRLWQRAEQELHLLDRLEADVRADLATTRMEHHALTREYEALLRSAGVGSRHG